MSSTDMDQDKELADFYLAEFGRAGRLLAERGVCLLETMPDRDRASYYMKRQRTRMERGDFELALETTDGVTCALQTLWTGPEAAHLAELSEKILTLAPRFASRDQDAHVSPHMYVMF